MRGALTGLLLTGITYEKARGKWRARAGTGEDRYHVGLYATEEEAAAALRAEQEQERRRGAELEDPIDRMCEQFPDDVAQAQRLQKKLAAICFGRNNKKGRRKRLTRRKQTSSPQ